MVEKNLQQEERNPIELVSEDFKLHPISSGERIGASKTTKDAPKIVFSSEISEESAENLVEVEKVGIGKEEREAKKEKDEIEELLEPKLPPLPMINRAQLQMQSPNRAFFYWSLKSNPFSTLQKIFGRSALNYKLVAKLINQTENSEQIFPIDIAGSTWFDVESDSTYRVEIGLLAPNRPFIRLLFSNTVQTPRSAPSPYFDWSPEFAISAQDFAEVLDAAGFKQDAIEMALAGDQKADIATQNTFFSLFGQQFLNARLGELRYALFALASGLTLEDLRYQISPSLFALLEKLMLEMSEQPTAEKIRAVLYENFDIGEEVEEPEEIEVEIEETVRVFGASLINFGKKAPRRFKLPKKFPKISPVSSSKF
jgi:hypothetical protein